MAAEVDPMSLGMRYKDQLTQTVGTLQQGAMNVKQLAETTVNEYKTQLMAQREQLQPQAQAILDGFKASVMDLQSPVPTNAAPFLLKSYMWSSVCLVAFTVARIVSGMFLGGLFRMMFDWLPSMLLVYVALPAFVFIYLRKVQMTEVEREQAVLFGSVAEGALVGCLFSNRFLLIIGPPLFLLPLVIGLIAHFVGSKDSVAGNRTVFLGALVGGGVLGYCIIGFVFNFNFSYILSMLILGAAAAADLQLKVASFQRGDSSPQLEQWKTVVFMTIAGAITHAISSTSKAEDAKEASSVVPTKE